MKLTRRDFLKGGAITALALAVGLKPKAPPKTLYMVSDTHFGRNVSVMYEAEVVNSKIVSLGDLTKDQYDRAYGGAAGGGKTGYGGFLVPPEFYTILLQGDFLEGDPNDPPLTYFGFSVIPTEKLKEVR